MLGVARRVNSPPQGLDIVRVLLAEVALEHILQHSGHHPWMKREAIGLPDSVDVVIGGEFDEDEIPAADTRLRIADDVSAQIGQFHNRFIHHVNEYDYIIVGAGTAGCVLANRLTASGAHRVLLLEAGGSDRSIWIQVPVGYARTFHDPRFNWMYEAEPDPALDNRRNHWPRGKVLGGSDRKSTRLNSSHPSISYAVF